MKQNYKNKNTNIKLFNHKINKIIQHNKQKFLILQGTFLL